MFAILAEAVHCIISWPGIKMKVLFTDICKSGNRYNITDDAWFAETGLLRKAPVQAELELNRKGDSRVELRGFLHTGVSLACDRCLADYNFDVKVDFHFVLTVPNEESWRVKEVKCTKADIDIVQLKEPVIDFSDILRQQLYLSLPFRKICSGDCKGLCSECGVNLNSGQCDCAKEPKNSPFAVLALLKRD